MEIVKNEPLLERMIEQYKINEYFTDFAGIRSGIKLIQFPRQTYIYEMKEHRKYAYFLVDGKLSVYATAENGEQMLLRYCDSFIFLGDMEFLGYEDRSVITETATTCLFVALDLTLLRDKLLMDSKFLLYIGKNLAEKINYFARNQFHNKLINPRQKVVSHIIQVGGDCGYFRENLRKTAEKLDISYRHLHRILAELVAEGVLERSERGYEIRKIKRLEELYWEYENQ